MTPFNHEPLTDFASRENEHEMHRVLALVKTQLGREYPMVIGGDQYGGRRMRHARRGSRTAPREKQSGFRGVLASDSAASALAPSSAVISLPEVAFSRHTGTR